MIEEFTVILLELLIQHFLVNLITCFIDNFLNLSWYYSSIIKNHQKILDFYCLKKLFIFLKFVETEHPLGNFYFIIKFSNLLNQNYFLIGHKLSDY